MIRHIGIITGNYPTPFNECRGTFVRQVVHAWARGGVRCTVIHPVAVHSVAKGLNRSRHWDETQPGEAEVDVHMPVYPSFSTKKLGPLKLGRWTVTAFSAAVCRTLRSIKNMPDALYGHFLFPSGAAALRNGSRFGIPAFPCLGEGELWGVNWVGASAARREYHDADGILAVSSHLKRLAVEVLGVSEERIGVFPNGTTLDVFHPRDRTQMREKYNLPGEQFLVAFVGHFLEKKGVLQAVEATRDLDNVGLMLIGYGPLAPDAPHLVFKNRVSHDIVPELLGAADLFLLPTEVEGSCNALIEAGACGLPVVSSNGKFNDDILDDSWAVRTNPQDTAAIRNAILKLRDNTELRERMARSARENAVRFDINRRVVRMKEWMEGRIRACSEPSGATHQVRNSR